MRLWLRTAIAASPWVLLIAATGAFAWLTRNPEAAVVDWAKEKPVVGPVARGFQARWAPHAVQGGPEMRAPAPSEEWDQTPRRVGLSAIEIAALDARPRAWAEIGALVRERPDPEAAVVHGLEAVTGLPYLAREGDWFHVRTLAFEGWVELPGYGEVSNPPRGSGQHSPTARPTGPTPPEHLESARSLLGTAARERELGPYTLLTDVTDRRLLDRLTRIAESLDDAFAARFGVEPLGEPAETVVLFASERAYRSLQDESPDIAGLAATGHAGGGMAALFVGDRDLPEIEATLIHELTHLVTRRAVGPAPPAWLGEGLADELALSRWDASGMPVTGSFSGARTIVSRHRESFQTDEERGIRIEERYELSGGLAARAAARDAFESGSLLPLEGLTSLEWREFVGGASAVATSEGTGKRLHYAESFLFVRFLLSEPDLVEGFQRFLAEVAEGGPASGEALRARLETPWPELDRRFHAWLVTG